MSGGKSLKILPGILEKYFELDDNGALFPRKDALRTADVARRIAEQLAGDENLRRDLIRKTFSTDVEFAMRPYGSTPVIGSGVKMFGTSPLRRLGFSGKIDPTKVAPRQTSKFRQICQGRAAKMKRFVKDAVQAAKNLEAHDDKTKALKEVEILQAHTGGGYDNTEAYSITKSLLSFLSECAIDAGTPNSQESSIVMRETLKMKDRLMEQLKCKPGELVIESYELVRLMQESDGMIGYPVMKKASAELTMEVALRISQWSGVDCRHLVGKSVSAVTSEGPVLRTAQVVDAMCFALDHSIASPEDIIFAAIIWTLARIQRSGYKEEQDDLVVKDGKSRSVSPNAAFSGAQEAMVFDPFIKLMKERKCPWMPSLQDRETADTLIWQWYENTLVPKGMRPLPADWSGYDKTIKGWIMATWFYYVVRPLYHYDAQKWVDLAIVSLVFKYFIISKTCAAQSPEEWHEIQLKYDVYDIDEEFCLVGTYNGLGSGAKATHVGGSGVGELLIHHCIPSILGYEGVDGPQAGDDTSLGIPESMIDLTSAEKTYAPIADAASKFGLKMNTGKQMWVVGGGEVMNIFLQYAYNYNLDIKGIGTGSRFYAAYPFAERDKFLSLGEQYMAIISKFNNGWNNPWIRVWIRKWLDQDPYICVLFKHYGSQAFTILSESIGTSLDEVSKRLELTYNWGLTTEQLKQGDVPVVPIIAEVAKDCRPKASLEEAIRQLKLIGSVNSNSQEDDVEVADDDFNDEELTSSDE